MRAEARGRRANVGSGVAPAQGVGKKSPARGGIIWSSKLVTQVQDRAS